MRDKLIHGYFGVDTGLVWDTARNDIPMLKQEIIKSRIPIYRGFSLTIRFYPLYLLYSN